MFVNGKSIETFKGVVTDDFRVGPASYTSNYMLGGGSTTPLGYGTKVGARPITLPVAFHCDTTREAYIQRALLQEELSKGTVELYDDDANACYSSVMTNVSDDEELFEGLVVATFELVGVLHDPLVTKVQDGPFTPLGVSKGGEDCRLSVTVATLEGDGTYVLGDVTFDAAFVSVGTKIILDGFAKIVYINGGPTIGACNLIRFPKLYPGRPNFFECKDPVTVEYFPVYK